MAKKRLAKKSAAKKSDTPARKTTRKKPKAASGATTKTSASRSSKKAVKKAAGGKTVKAARKKTGAQLASQLTRLDKEIIKLVNQRAETTVRWIEQQPNRSEVLFNPRADDDLWAELSDANNGPISTSALRGVFREILSAARNQVKTLRVAYLGPPFSFTHLAAIERFGESADLLPVSTIASVFEEVNRGHANYGLVPIENSTDGRVVDTLYMFQKLPLRICGEVQISVHHNLMARCDRGEITEIYSKPQALSQCREWLSRNMPQARLIEVTSTSTAAQLARDKHGAAAVASRQAAVQYGLQIIAGDIEDNVRNVTRFAVIGEDVSKPSGRDRTAVLLQIAHKPGSLTDALTIFKNNKINLTWIESFPLRGEEGGYLFFLDFEGHEKDAKVNRTLNELARMAVRLNVLGSYPRSEPLD